MHNITLTSTMGTAARQTTQSWVTVQDTTGPSVAAASASPSVLNSVNHVMQPVTVSVSASDLCSGVATCQIHSVSCNEPVNGLGDGDTAPDWAITGPLTLNLRAERAGRGSGRVYSIVIRCTDGSDNTSSRTVTVSVPH